VSHHNTDTAQLPEFVPGKNGRYRKVLPRKQREVSPPGIAHSPAYISRQKDGLNRTSMVKISRRPRSMANAEMYFAASLNEAKV
jgi:hypothetical protein